jgi:hypothetical protein
VTTSAALSLASAGVLATIVLWMIGGTLLRVAGLMVILAGLASTAISGRPSGAVAALIGSVVWLAGHWLYAVRHHHFRSPLARRIFLTVLPAPLDPTRGWGVPNVPPRARR